MTSEQPNKEISAELGEMIYRYIYKRVSENIGKPVVMNMTHLSENSYDRENPTDSINKLVEALTRWLGQRVVENIIINVEREITDQNAKNFLNEIKSGK